VKVKLFLFGYKLFLFFYEGHSYNQSERIVCAGYDNGDIKMFDLRNMSLKWETHVKNGVCLYYPKFTLTIIPLGFIYI